LAAVFLKIVSMSLSASIIAAAALLLRPLLKKAPKWVRCLLWALVAVRLVCPFSVESRASIVPESIGDGSLVSGWTESYSVKTGSPDGRAEHIPAIPANGAAESGEGQGSVYEVAEPSLPNAEKSIVPLLAWIWLAGAAAMLLYALISSLRLKRRVREAICAGGNVWLSDRIDSPFILGVFRPKIYLPAGISGETAEQVLAHERAHLARRDHWWKPLGFLLLAVYWFNPVLWLAYILLCRDIELACDEKVIRTFDSEEKQAYAETLLECSLPRFAVSACPLAFGEVGVKERIRAVVNYKKPAFWIIIAALCACAALAVCLLTNPKAARIKLPREEITGVSVFHLENVEKDGVYELNAAETDELADRVNDLRGLSRGDKYAGLTPLYGIQASTRNNGYMHIRGYNADGSMTDIYYKGKVYRVNDGEFRDYVLRICEGLQRAEAPNAGSAAQPGNTEEQAEPTVAEIIDRSDTEGIATDQATELFWETDGQEFYFPSIKSHLIIVRLTNGEELPVKEALEKGIVTLYDLGKSGIEFYGLRKELVPMEDFGGVEYLNDEAFLSKLFNMPTAWICAYYLNSDGAFAEGAADELNARNAQEDISPVIEMVAERYPENADAIRNLLYQAITTAAPGDGRMAVTQYGPKANEDVVSVQLRPTERIDIDGYGYYVPQDQEVWKAAWDEAVAASRAWDRIPTAAQSGMLVSRGGEYMVFYVDGSFGTFGIDAQRIDAGDGAALASLMRETGAYFGIDPVYPQQLRGIKCARLQLGYNEVHEITDAQTLAKIESMLSTAEPLGGMSKCWFTSLLTLELESGEEYTISIATDSCGVYLSDGLVFRFASDNEEFYELFGVRLWD